MAENDAILAAQIGKQLLETNEELSQINASLQHELKEADLKLKEQSTILERYECNQFVIK